MAEPKARADVLHPSFSADHKAVRSQLLPWKMQVRAETLYSSFSVDRNAVPTKGLPPEMLARTEVLSSMDQQMKGLPHMLLSSDLSHARGMVASCEAEANML